MNYRHAFHAGNFADCMKHALLVSVVRALGRKPAPFRVLDTHAGAGAYDLGSDEARRGGEWQAGVGRVLDATEGPLADYAALVREAGAPAVYPGSPALVAALLATVVLRLRNRRYRRIAAEERVDRDADGVPDVYQQRSAEG